MRLHIIITTTIAMVLMAAAAMVLAYGMHLMKKWRELDNEREQRGEIREMAQGGYPFLRFADDPDLDDGADSLLDDYGSDGGGGN